VSVTKKKLSYAINPDPKFPIKYKTEMAEKTL